MSEWLANQNKSSANFRKLLQERIENANPRRELTSEESKRLSKEFGFTAGKSYFCVKRCGYNGSFAMAIEMAWAVLRPHINATLNV
ncbi:MAG: hypothetical protein CMK25_05715 [Porticoccaceae bacterium]|nr:hypothetical protein [Porticoccaceae bacterium]MDG2116949.1 hypothetical protein [Porticoccaceae bacterium]